MKKALLCMSFVWVAVLACPKASLEEAEDVGVAQVAAWLRAGEATPIDVNVEEVRAEYGQLPGAVLLDSSSGYEASGLPADKQHKLVFYCLNKLCTASHVAARRAKGFGYKNVYVMSAGIKAWKETSTP
jgi:rhodanese-related sulfurtransferase